MAHTEESHRWYAKDGAPVFEVTGAKGQSVTPNIRHARKMGLLPSVTSVMRVLAAPGLERWKREQAVLAALTLTRQPQESDKDFLRRVEEDSRAHTEQRANEGTEIHKAIEQFLRGEPYNTKWHTHVSAVLTTLGKYQPSFVGDFKTKETLEGKTERDLFFDEHIMQLAAYREGIRQHIGNLKDRQYQTETTFAHPMGYGGRVDVHTNIVHPSSPLVSILISVKEPGLVIYKIWGESEAQRGWEMFSHALSLWKLKNKYESAAHE